MANFELGPCQILYTDVDGSSGGLVDLGKTFGGVKVTIEESSQQLKTFAKNSPPVRGKYIIVKKFVWLKGLKFC